MATSKAYICCRFECEFGIMLHLLLLLLAAFCLVRYTPNMNPDNELPPCPGRAIFRFNATNTSEEPMRAPMNSISAANVGRPFQALIRLSRNDRIYTQEDIILISWL